MNKKRRVVIIGIDGVPYSLLKNLSDSGIMHNFNKLKKEGIFKKQASSIPANSAVSWSTIITGKNPGEHSIYGFSDMIDGTYTMSFPNFSNLKSSAFWQRDKGTYVIINVPSTYPVKKMNGCHISGFISLDLDKAVYPPSCLKFLNDIDYSVDVDAGRGHKSKRLLLEDLFKTHEKRMAAYRHLWDKYNWDVFMLVFTGSDRIGHFLWDAYEDENHKCHGDFLEYFKKIDESIGEINDRLDENDSLIILSDHGMERVDFIVNLNAALIENGFLRFGNNPNKRYNNIGEGSKAFALEDGRIYINKKGKYPTGCVNQSNEDELIDKLIEVFTRLGKNDKKIIKEIYKKEDLFCGKYINNAPDMVLLPNKGFNLRGKLVNNLFEESPLTGMHNQEAFIFIKDKKNKNIISENPSVEDVVPTIDRLLGDDYEKENT